MAEGAKTILVVDDDPDTRTFLTTVLEDNGFKTLTAEDGNQALAKLAQQVPDLIALDITMPEKSGVAVYRQVREDNRFKSIPVIIITGVSNEFEKFISTRRQVPPPDDYLNKPVEPADLIKKVRKILA
jgi:CheY-like chemotaxis protein